MPVTHTLYPHPAPKATPTAQSAQPPTTPAAPYLEHTVIARFTVHPCYKSRTPASLRIWNFCLSPEPWVWGVEAWRGLAGSGTRSARVVCLGTVWFAGGERSRGPSDFWGVSAQGSQSWSFESFNVLWRFSRRSGGKKLVLPDLR